MREFEFTVETIPRPKERPRFMRIKSKDDDKKEFVKTYTPKKTQDYERLIAEQFLAQGGTVFDYPYLEMSVTAYFPIPKSTRKAEKLLYSTGNVPYPHKPDTDNVGKAVLDALNQVAYLDDKQVVFLKVKKFYGSVPKIIIKIREIEVNGGEINSG